MAKNIVPLILLSIFLTFSIYEAIEFTYSSIMSIIYGMRFSSAPYYIFVIPAHFFASFCVGSIFLIVYNCKSLHRKVVKARLASAAINE